MNPKSAYRLNPARSIAAFLLFTVLLVPSFRAARAEETGVISDLTSRCAIRLPEDSAAFAARLSDNRYNSRISFSKGEALEVALADGAKGLYIAWYNAPEAARVESLDSAGAVLDSIAANPDLINEYYPLPKGSATVRIAGGKSFSVCELRVYDSENPPEELCIMGAQETQPKAMLILAHTADEAYDFGCLLPFFTGGDAALVFLSSESRQAQQQAIEGRYALGSRTQPIFAGFPYYWDAKLDLKKMYGLIDQIQLSDYLIRLVRRYQPETLITHAENGERGDGMHLLTASHVLLAAEQAADPGKEYVSEREYGVWQVKAVYRHQESGGYPVYDTHSPIAAFGGKSAYELAQSAYRRYTSFDIYHDTVTDAPYFVQAFPADESVSEAQSAKQLYSLLASLSGPAALPAAAMTPEPAVSPEPEAEPAIEKPAPDEPAQPAVTAAGNKTIYYMGIGLFALGALVTVLGLAARFRFPQSKPMALRTVGTAVGILLAVCGVALTLRAGKPDDAPQAATPSPTPSASASAPAETPTPIPTSTPTPDPLASHFRKQSDPAEVVVFDYENGIFEYRSDTLAVEIRRITRTDPPVVYYVAHIYERDENSYRSGFGSERQNGRDPMDAGMMARRYRAVLGLTGDNLIYTGYIRGLMIRNGRIFRAMTMQSAMALTDDLSMRIYAAGDPAMLNEIEEGTRDTYAFGPPLIVDGAICEKVDEDRVSPINPRAGLGLVEPGHFVAIVVDGRMRRYSVGVLLSDFAQMFLDEGCVMAYNLDGGASATMVFMGEYINHRADNHTRRVPDQLLWGYSELVPGVDEPRLYPGLVPQDWNGKDE